MFVHKLLVADYTLEPFCDCDAQLGVAPLVAPQDVLPPEGLVADFTLEGLLPQMHQFVRNDILLVLVGLVAIVAMEQRIRGELVADDQVDFLVLCQMADLRERPCTDSALVGSLPRVGPLVGLPL